MRKLKAIWQILFADQWAVFTFEEAALIQHGLKCPISDGIYRIMIQHSFGI